MGKRHVFSAIIPTPEIVEEVTEYKRVAARRFQSQHAFRSPPHITLVPPFHIDTLEWERLLQIHRQVAGMTKSFRQTLDGFGSFPPRVIFIEPRLNNALQALHDILIARLESAFPGAVKDRRPFHPHITIAYKDLRREVFPDAWAYFSKKQYQREWEVTDLCILRHMGSGWQVASEFHFLKGN